MFVVGAFPWHTVSTREKRGSGKAQAPLGRGGATTFPCRVSTVPRLTPRGVIVFRILRRPRRTALVAVGALVVGGLTVVANPAHAAVACQVNYSKAWDNNGGGFGGNLTIINLGDPLTSWTLTFAFPNQQRVDQGWSANWSQSGQNVTATNAPWNGNLPTNAQLGIGFNGSYTGGVNNNPQT